MQDKQRCCGTCRYHEFFTGEWCCDNEEAEAYGLETEADDYCDEYGEREGHQ